MSLVSDSETQMDPVPLSSPCEQLWGVRNRRWVDQVSAVAEEQRRTHQSFAEVKRLQHLVAGWWLFTLEGEGRDREEGGRGGVKMTERERCVE